MQGRNSKVKIKMKVPRPQRDISGNAYLPVLGPLARSWINHCVLDAWPERRQTYGYLPSVL